MKPVARLHLIKQREYEKRCPPGGRFGGGGAVGNPSIGMYNSGGKIRDMFWIKHSRVLDKLCNI